MSNFKKICKQIENQISTFRQTDEKCFKHYLNIFLVFIDARNASLIEKSEVDKKERERIVEFVKWINGLYGEEDIYIDKFNDFYIITTRKSKYRDKIVNEKKSGNLSDKTLAKLLGMLYEEDNDYKNNNVDRTSFGIYEESHNIDLYTQVSIQKYEDDVHKNTKKLLKTIEKRCGSLELNYKFKIISRTIEKIDTSDKGVSYRKLKINNDAYLETNILSYFEDLSKYFLKNTVENLVPLYIDHKDFFKIFYLSSVENLYKDWSIEDKKKFFFNLNKDANTREDLEKTFVASYKKIAKKEKNKMSFFFLYL